MKEKIPPLPMFLIILFFCLCNINYANVINQFSDTKNAVDKIEKLKYTFKVSDKLIGKGEIEITIHDKKIFGIATGIGMTSQCDVELHSKIEGTVGGSINDIDVTVFGEGEPQIPLPGKIKFNGPLRGFVHKKKLCLNGDVHIKGRLAYFAGFKNTEDLFIEIEGIDNDKLVQHP